MPRIQALVQQRSLERSASPTQSMSFKGMSGASEGVPKMHPLKSSMLMAKASNLVHGLKIKKFKLGSVKLPGIK